MELQGSLKDFSLNDIISLASLSKYTGAAEIEGLVNNQSVTGRLYFKQGNVVHANLLDLPPLEAALTCFNFKEGAFRFLAGVISEREELRISNDLLIMRGHAASNSDF
jgi:hypothetical protein